ncbi:MAG: hypothetical protein ACE5FT_00530 [Candidatus Nanoarchaeia archaeon]
MGGKKDIEGLGIPLGRALTPKQRARVLHVMRQHAWKRRRFKSPESVDIRTLSRKRRSIIVNVKNGQRGYANDEINVSTLVGFKYDKCRRHYELAEGPSLQALTKALEKAEREAYDNRAIMRKSTYPKPVKGEYIAGLSSFDKKTKEDFVGMAKLIDRQLRKDPRIESSNVSFIFELDEEILQSSRGDHVKQELPKCYILVGVEAADPKIHGDDFQWYKTYGSFGSINQFEKAFKQAYQEAPALADECMQHCLAPDHYRDFVLGTGLYDTILMGETLGIFLEEYVGHPLEHLVNETYRTNRLFGPNGMQFHPAMSIVDYAGAKLGGNWTPAKLWYDTEIIEATKKFLLRNGRPEVRALATIDDVARALVEEGLKFPTGSARVGDLIEEEYDDDGETKMKGIIPSARMTNFYMLPGSSTMEEIMEAGRGGLIIHQVAEGLSHLPEFMGTVRAMGVSYNDPRTEKARPIRIRRPGYQLFTVCAALDWLHKVSKIGNKETFGWAPNFCGADSGFIMKAGGGPAVLLDNLQLSALYARKPDRRLKFPLEKYLGSKK